MGPIEFLEDGPDDTASDDAAFFVAPGRPPARSRWLRALVAIGAVAALGLAAVVARASGDDPVTPALPRPVTSTPVVFHPVPAVQTVQVDPGGGGVVYLAGCTGCARVLVVPGGVRRAVLALVPGATLSGAYTVISSTTGHVFSRGLIAHGRSGRLTVEVTLTIEGPEYTASRVVGRVTVAQVQHAGYHVTVRAYGLRAPVGRLLHFAANPALIADG